MRMRMSVAAVVCLAASVSAQAQDLPAPLPQVLYESVPPNGNRGKPASVGAQALSMVGREDRVDSFLPVCAAQAGDPIAAIVERAKATRIVIINEAHDTPRHRAFIAEVAKALRPLGYSIFAGETFAPSIKTGGAPLIGDGAYLREPVFGEEVRALRRLGYELAAYEAIPGADAPTDIRGRVAYREATQADNLIKLLAANPKAKMIVHVSYTHALEGLETPVSAPWMAARFKEKSGIDPLTIGQTYYSGPNEAPVLCVTDGRVPVDMQIGHPLATFTKGRPNWRIALGQKPTPIPASMKRAEGAIYEARRADEPDDAVPADRLLVEPGETLDLLLAPGAYRLTVWTEKGGYSAPEALTVR